jgi:type IV pilus assembly protein PilP
MISLYSGLAAQEESADRDSESITEEVSDSAEPEAGETADMGYVYDPTGKNDPFQSFIVIAEEKEEDERKEPKTYLETLELSQLDLAATIIGPKGKWAIVKDSKDDMHIIKEGTPIGTNGGVVYEIRQGEAVIREEFRDFRGETQHREISKKPPSAATLE